MQILNKIRGWRTLASNGLVAFLSVLELAEVLAVLPGEWLPWFMLGLAMTNMLLRWLTTTPVGRAT